MASASAFRHPFLRLPTALGLVAVLPAVLFGAACERSAPAGTAPAQVAAGQIYSCPMHPFITSDKPGDCPICNMRLVLTKPEATAPQAGAVEGRGRVAIPVDLQRRIGLRTATVAREPFARTIRAAARVEVDERGLSAVSLRYAGWIEELFVRATGEAVRAGEPLLSVYSPELYEAQRSYLFARGAMGAEDDAVSTLRERLLLWDMTAEQIAALEARGEPEPATVVLAKRGGVVTRREAVLGMRTEPGTTLFEIADLSTVWVIADVYEDEIPLVRVGSPVSIEIASVPGGPIEGRVAWIAPTLSDATRTARVRIEVRNEAGAIRPGAYAVARIESDLGEQLVVDVDAVLDTGTRRIAFVETEEGIFDPRPVELGARDGGRAVVLSGLAAGEKVVARAAFLVDSESRLKAALR